MLKFDIKKEKEEKKVECELYLDDDGDITLNIGGDDVLSIMKDGQLIRHMSVSDDIGLRVDDKGRIKMDE